jgi:hypothetical protein
MALVDGTVMAVSGAFALAAFFLRDADWRVARRLWWLTALLAAGTAVLVYLLATNAALYRAFFGGP